MKPVLAYLTAGVVAALSSSAAKADLLLYEPFDYATGAAVVGQTDIYSPGSPVWARAGTANSATVHQVAAGSLSGPAGFPASIGNMGDMKGVDNTEYARMSLGLEYLANASLYYSVLLNVPATTGLTTAHSNANANNDGVIAFNNSAGTGTRPNSWGGELTLRLGSATSTFNLGIRGSTTAANTTFWSGDLTPGQTYLVVVNFTEGATAGTGGLNSMWINPDPSTFGALSAPNADGSSTGTYSTTAANDHTDSLIIGAGIAAGADPNDTYLDEIRVGNTWADVTSVPEPSTLALAGFGVVAFMARYRTRRL